MWDLDHKEGWAPNNWCFRVVVLEKILESPLDSKKIKPVDPKGSQPWIFTGRTDAVAKAPILRPPDVKSQLLEKTRMLGKFKGKKRRGWQGWDGWMASLTQWTWVWVSSQSWWWIGKPGVLQSMGSQRIWHDRATELNWNKSCSTTKMRHLRDLKQSPIL